MSAQYIVNEAGERVSVILPIAEYQALLERVAAAEEETAYLLRSPENARLLRERWQDVKQGRRVQEGELLPDES